MKFKVILLFMSASLIANEVGIVNPYLLNVRSSKKVENNVIAQIKKGEQYIIQSKKHGWCKLKDKGFVDCSFLTIKNPQFIKAPITNDLIFIDKKIEPCNSKKNEIKKEDSSCSLNNPSKIILLPLDNIDTNKKDMLDSNDKLIKEVMLKMIDEINSLKIKVHQLNKEIRLLKEEKK